MKNISTLTALRMFLLVGLAAAPSLGQTCAQFRNYPTRPIQAPLQTQRQWLPPAQEYRQSNVAPESRSYNNVGENRPNIGANHANGGGVHINPEYFASHYGSDHRFHFGGCDRRLFGGEWYFYWNGGWFGIMGALPEAWGDDFYIGMGSDGNYYLFDSEIPAFAVQLTFVQDIGDDQAGAEENENN